VTKSGRIAGLTLVEDPQREFSGTDPVARSQWFAMPTRPGNSLAAEAYATTVSFSIPNQVGGFMRTGFSMLRRLY
jgi:hypothetical protein